MVLKAALVGILAFAVAVNGEVFFKETFSDSKWRERWVDSDWKSDLGQFVLSSGETWNVDPAIEQGIQVQDDARFYAISSKFKKSFSNKDQDLVVQYTVKNEGKESSFCGGGYIKLLPSNTDQSKFGGDSPYSIMFGPDMCGYDVSRIHLIFSHEGQNLLKNEDIKLDYEDKDDKTHLYTLVLRPDNTYTVFFDQQEKAHGFLHDEWDFPNEEINDPTDVKPADWVDDEMIDDPEDKKPEDWDNIPPVIPDPEAKRPDDWDEEDDGEWEAPMISNPEYKGEWKPKRIKNPEFKGKWIQKKIANPQFQKDVYSYNDIGAVGFELWIVNSGSLFDNIYVGNSIEEAQKMADETWGVIHPKETSAKEEWEKVNKKPEDVNTVTDDAEDDDEPQDLDAPEIKGKEEL